MLAIGPPINTSSSGLTRQAADQTVVSVGPYMFQREPPLSSNCRARSFGQGSPPHNILRRGLPLQPADNNIFQVLGVACITVAWHRVSSSAKACPSRAFSLLAITVCAPTIRGSHNSNPAMSKHKVVIASHLSCAAKPGVWLMDSRKFTMAPC